MQHPLDTMQSSCKFDNRLSTKFAYACMYTGVILALHGNMKKHEACEFGKSRMFHRLRLELLLLEPALGNKLYYGVFCKPISCQKCSMFLWHASVRTFIIIPCSFRVIKFAQILFIFCCCFNTYLFRFSVL